MTRREFDLRVEIERSKDPQVRTPQEYERGRIVLAKMFNREFVDLPKQKRGRKRGFHFNRN